MPLRTKISTFLVTVSVGIIFSACDSTTTTPAVVASPSPLPTSTQSSSSTSSASSSAQSSSSSTSTSSSSISSVSSSSLSSVSQNYIANPVHLSAAWANDGGDKVAQQETRASNNVNVANSIWKNSSIQLFGAKNEIVAFNLVLEALTQSATGVAVSFNLLNGPNGFQIKSTPATGDGVFDWTHRDIELFYVRYLQIRGLSKLGYETYDERHIPKRLQRPYTGAGVGSGLWTDRPDHDRSYPDIAVPLEMVPTFSLAAHQSQSIWSDLYIPKNAPPGVYQGLLTVTESGHLSYQIPVALTVRNFALPDVPNSKTMVNLGYSDIATRYVGVAWPNPGPTMDSVQLIRDRHFQMAHRHKISMIDSNEGTLASPDQPSLEWANRLNGNLFTSANGYRGPGENQGNNVFSIGTYGSWSWKTGTQADMWSHLNTWANWFSANAPSTENFLYLSDESSNYAQTDQWASWAKSNPGSGRSIASMATMPLPTSLTNTPNLQVTTSTMDVGDTNTWQNAVNTVKNTAGKRFYMYNGKRPASGSFMVDDDGVALRELAWGQYKKKIDRWFYWESTYYNDFQNGRGQNDVFTNAQTFGPAPSTNAIMGQTSGNYANGDGVLFYPGSDTVFTNSSYGLKGPIASLRLKHWRRGIQDVDYLTLASAINPTKVQQIVNSTVSSVLWENGIADPNDPTWVRCDIGWSINPDVWESARSQLADIIEGK